MPLILTTPAFTPEEQMGSGPVANLRGLVTIPAKHAMRAVPGGRNVSIPYAWSGVAEATRSFALSLIDRSPVAHDWVHWMIIDIAPDARSIPEGASQTARMPTGATETRNTFGFLGYGGPQPPAGSGAHIYVATLYALDVARLDLPAGATAADLLRAIAGHVLASATCTGRFGR